MNNFEHSIARQPRARMQSVSVLALVLVCIVFAACGDDSQGPSCDGVTCSGNGTCVGVEGVATCACESGYNGDDCGSCAAGHHDDGTSVCVIDQQCITTSCAGGGACDDSSGIVECTCSSGHAGTYCDSCAADFHRTLEGTCEADQSCAATDPCGDYGTCGDAGGVLSCLCDDGYTGGLCDSCYPGYHDDGLGACVLDQQCLGTSCSGAGECTAAAGIVSCTCDAGHSGEYCEVIDGFVPQVCSPGLCGPGGTCITLGDDHICSCPPGWGGLDCQSPSGRIAATLHHTCGIQFDNEALCWGWNNYEQTSVPAAVSFEEVAVGNYASCGITETTGDLSCRSTYPSATPPPTGAFTQLAMGDIHYCALGTDASVQCWGIAYDGEDSPPPFDYVDIAAGQQFSCGVQTNGDISCWGGPIRGYGAGTLSECEANCSYPGVCSSDSGPSGPWECFTALPSQAEGPYVQVSAAGTHVCGLHTDGSVRCWGADTGGQTSPPDVEFVQLAAGYSGSCGVQSDGEISCWGAALPAAPPGPFVAVARGSGYACALRADESVECWGSNPFGGATAAPGWTTP